MKRLLLTLLLPAVLSAGVARAGGFEPGESAQDLPLPPLPPDPTLSFIAGPGAGVPGGDLPMDPGRLVGLAGRLDLTPEQRRDLGRIVDDTAQKLRELLFRLDDARAELEAAVDSGAADDATLRRLADELGGLHADLLHLQLGARTKLRALLNAQQRRKFEQARPRMGPAWPMRAFARHGPAPRLNRPGGEPPSGEAADREE